jgi:hypothetical protein
VPTAIKRRVGRPVKSLFEDRDRYLLAWFQVLVAKGRSADWAGKLIALTEHAAPSDVWSLEELNLPSWINAPAPSLLMKWERIPGRRIPSTLRSRARTLQIKLARYRQVRTSAFWLDHMARAWAVALSAQDSSDEQTVAEHIVKAGEIPFYVNILRPLMRARYRSENAPPNFL